ncbi:MAG: ribonuclease III [Mogibacterium sp.]|nr:ribonuclease III [Mogibacterium sp.]
MSDIKDLERVLGYTFRNPDLLTHALTHSSYTSENEQPYEENNERLEFIGDAVLDAIVGIALYEVLTTSREGDLTKKRAYVVCERSLAESAREIGLGAYLRLGHGEEITGGRDKDSILADAFEAVIGAVAIDSGYENARYVVLHLLMDSIIRTLNGSVQDYKTELQERAQEHFGKVSIRYNLDRAEGPDHNKTFTVTVLINGNRLGTGQGRTKKEAEQNAARNALTKGEE